MIKAFYFACHLAEDKLQAYFLSFTYTFGVFIIDGYWSVLLQIGN